MGHVKIALSICMFSLIPMSNQLETAKTMLLSSLFYSKINASIKLTKLLELCRLAKIKMDSLVNLLH